MADGKQCPACGRDIGVWPIVSAGLPSRIRCPHCFARIRYRGFAGVLLFLLAAFPVVAVAALWAASVIPGLSADVQPYAAVGILLVSWAAVELAVARFLRGNRELFLPGNTCVERDCSSNAEPHDAKDSRASSWVIADPRAASH
jgi:hypothetical protein